MSSLLITIDAKPQIANYRMLIAILNAFVKFYFARVNSKEIKCQKQIKKLIAKKMLIPEKDGTRKYILRFDNNYLLRSVIKVLGEKGFLPIKGDV